MKNFLCHTSGLLVAMLFVASTHGDAFGAVPQKSNAVSENDVSSKHSTEIDRILSKYHEYGQLNGSVLVAEKGEVIFRKGFGLANMEWDVPNSPDTKFRIGSVTKQFTAALILQLVESGKVQLDQPVSTYLPKYRKDTGERFTVHHLLCHTSGVPSYTTPEFFRKYSRDSYELDEFVSEFASGDLEFEPGSQYAYSNSGYHLLGAIIESVTGESYADALKKRILEPAGMENSGFDVSLTVLSKRAQGYARTSSGYVNAAYLDMGIPYSAGSMYSTVDDLFKWDRALREGKILKPETIALMRKPNLRDYGYGVEIERQMVDGSGTETLLIKHGGGVNGFNCLLSQVVGKEHVIVILDNVQLGQHHREIETAILKILADQPFSDPKRSIAYELVPIAEKDGGAAVVSRYRSLKKQQPDTFNFSNQEDLNGIGYQFVAQGKLDDAIEVFKLNVEQFPEAFNPYDSLGEAYLLKGEKELALSNYKKSVELNPESQTGILAIKKIEGQSVEIDVQTLESYVGKYEFQPGFQVTMTLEDGALMGQPTGQPKTKLEPVSTTKFIVPSVKANVEFQVDVDGAVTGVVLRQAGNQMEGKKVE